MGFSPAGAVEIVNEMNGDYQGLEDLLFELDDIARRARIYEMIRHAAATRAGGLSDKKGNAAYEKWVRALKRDAKPAERATVWENLRAAQPEKVGTVWERLRNNKG